MRIRIIDAFTDRPFAGNPAGVCLLGSGDWPSELWMQEVAAELNLSETAFARPLGGGEERWALRWFTPAVEVNLCGHATLAAAQRSTPIWGHPARSGSIPGVASSSPAPLRTAGSPSTFPRHSRCRSPHRTVSSRSHRRTGAPSTGSAVQTGVTLALILTLGLSGLPSTDRTAFNWLSNVGSMGICFSLVLGSVAIVVFSSVPIPRRVASSGGKARWSARSSPP
ncbi:PhzF family phenazine biosynthesis protein [Cryptosporangium aurantiacum]|uniref:PhzF family phenazine biosynthesis protein n=1 Tax=Cryptosporangium aurantiacum TaxID=134849 RepID=UPI0009331BD4|nr:PhzF family phenazine biosynthesis isomerase [Cryptosporangium aurantiacum]